MKTLYIAAACCILCCGCVTHRGCNVNFAADHTEVGVSKDHHYLIPVPGICGFTDHAGCVRAFRLAGAKAEYHDTEIQELPVPTTIGGYAPEARPDIYRGSISISKEKKRVVVKLQERGYDEKYRPFDLNGRYHYD